MKLCTLAAVMSRLICIFCFGILLGSLQAQVNIIAGYDFSPARVDALNEVLRDFNTAYTHVIPFGEIKLMHGFVAGVKYRHRLGAFELAYYRHLNSQRSTNNEYQQPTGSETVKSNADFFYEMRTYSFTTQFGHKVHIGANIDRNTFVNEMDFESGDLRDIKTKQRNWGGRLFAGLELGNRTNISITTRVFYRFLLTDLSTTSIRSALNLSNDCTTCNYRPEVFGLSIIINNGPQE